MPDAVIHGRTGVSPRRLPWLTIGLLYLILLPAPILAAANPFAAVYEGLPTVTAGTTTVDLYEGSYQDNSGQTVTFNNARVRFTNLRTSDGFEAAAFAATFGTLPGTTTAYVQFNPAFESDLTGISGMIDLSIYAIDLEQPFNNPPAFGPYARVPADLRRAVLAVIAHLPSLIDGASRVQSSSPAPGRSLWSRETVRTMADRFVRTVFGNTLRAGPLYSSTNTSANSVLRFFNTGLTAGPVTVTLADLASGARIGSWTSPVIAPHASLEKPIAEIEESLPSFIRPAYYAVSVRTDIAGGFQHLLATPGAETLTNVTACESGFMTDAGHAPGLVPSRLPATPSTLVVANTGAFPATATLGLYDAATGAKIGIHTTAAIGAHGELRISAAELESSMIRMPANASSYNAQIIGAFPGYIRHTMSNAGAALATDMTAACSLGLIYPAARTTGSRIGEVHASGQSDVQSFLRFTNIGMSAGTVSVELFNPSTGVSLASWTSPPIPPGAVANHYIADLDVGVTEKPDRYALRVATGITGAVQHAVWRPGRQMLTNLSVCDAGVSGSDVLSSVHASALDDAYPATIAAMNTGVASARVTLGVHDARTGEKLGTYRSREIPNGGGLLIPIAELEASLSGPPGGASHYVVRTEGSFPGYLQHLMKNATSGAIVDMTARCLLDPAGGESAAVAYVAATGDDNGPGTLTQPWRTIQKCAGTLVRGGVCYVRAGRYMETVTPNSGISIAAYNGESVTIDGTDPLTEWSRWQGDIFQTDVKLLAADGNQIFEGQRMMTEARWPNGDNLLHPNWAMADAGTSDSTLVDSALPNRNWTGGFVNYWSGSNPWTHQSAAITSSLAGRLSHTLEIASLAPHFHPTVNGRYFIFGTREALDNQREWAYDHAAARLYFWPPGGADPGTLNVRVKRRALAVDLRGKSDVRLRGINVFAATIKMDPSSRGNSIDGMTATYVTHFTRNPDSAGVPRSGIYTGPYNESGIVLDGTRNSIENSTVRFSAGNGINVRGRASIARNNLVSHTGYGGLEGGGIVVQKNEHLIHRNTVHDTAGESIIINAFEHYTTLNIDIAYNNLYRGMLMSSDGGGIYGAMLADAGLTSRIHHNWVHDIISPYEYFGQFTGSAYNARGIYFDEYFAGWEVDQNVIWNTGSDSLNVHGSTDSARVQAVNHYIHNNSIPDANPQSRMRVNQVEQCGTMSIADNFILVPIVQEQAACAIGANGASAAGAIEMVAGVSVGCNFAGCGSDAPPPVVNGLVAASLAFAPYDIVVRAGENATLTAIGAGSGPISYQWRREGIDIPGATSASYTLVQARAADHGARFSVAVSNAVRTVVSEDAVLTVE